MVNKLRFSVRPASAAHANSNAQNAAHESHYSTVGALADKSEGQDDLTQRRFGDRKMEQNLVIRSGGSKGIVHRVKCPILLLQDKLSTDVVPGYQVADIGLVLYCVDGQVMH